MTRAMVDTHVLSYAISEPSSNPKVARTQRDSKALLTSLSEVRVSSIVVLEMLRAPPSVIAKLHASGLFDMLYVEPVDGGVLELGTFVNTVKVLYPPNLDGPLFSDTDG